MSEPNRIVESHYEALLASRYTWMLGGPSACHSSAKALLDAAGVVATQGDVALDLGAGGGYHARALAERGFEVIAIDTSAILLQELAQTCDGFGVTVVHGDLLDDRRYRKRAPFAVILCVGDTLTHLSTSTDVERLISLSAGLLAPGGQLVLQFREQPVDLAPADSVFTIRSERDRIMECVLHFEPERVWVTDVVHEWTGETWRAIRSTYPKLRLSGEALIACAAAAGLDIASDGMHARQRLLVFKRL